MIGTMKQVYTLLGLCILLWSCEKKNENTGEYCDPESAHAEIEWLLAWESKTKNCTCELSLYKGKINGRTVFYTRMTDLLCDGTPEIYFPRLIDCKGEYISDSSAWQYPLLVGEISDEKLLASCKQ